MTDDQSKENGLRTRPAVHLVYLVFLFLPWLFYPPGTIDVIATLLAAAVFIPIHFAGYNAKGRRRLWFIAAIALIGVAASTFSNGYSVFHIYAAASAGFLRPIRTSGIVLGLATLAFVASGLLAERFVLEIIIGMVISIVIWLSCFSEAETNAAYQQAERERKIEAQQASLIERERIARDLHDLLGHTLTLVSLKADLAGRLIDSDPQRAKAEIDNIQLSSRQALSDVRATLSGLTSTSVKQELKNGEAALKAAGVDLIINGAIKNLPPEKDTALGLMIREATTNVVRHSKASIVTISFDQKSDEVDIVFADNGDADGILEGNGLYGLRSRLEAMGGVLSVKEIGGLQLMATLPL